ncbi:hypothetical protein CDAR_461241 [Caerostris darwini]|uniref:Peptidase S1 domain-containing protein n=1 Tax=Caerostris darwini TaxID=1538125 RepID=A0AAV4SBF7_9ARAC|nr:hypothetical protein CDAR_461241 [Caerostris darwini]
MKIPEDAKTNSDGETEIDDGSRQTGGLVETCQKCGSGIANPEERGRVINGRPVMPPYKYPWIAGLLAHGGGQEDESYRMSSLPLTTSPKCATRVVPQCYRLPKEVSVGFIGTDEITSLRVKRIIPHPHFIPTTLTNDIGLLELEKPVYCSYQVGPICLPEKGMDRVGQKFITAGWGKRMGETLVEPEKLREGEMRQVSAARCHTREKPKLAYMSEGDSGSSIFIRYGQKYYALGLVSHNFIKVCPPSEPAAFTKLYVYVPWIKRHVPDLPRYQNSTSAN